MTTSAFLRSRQHSRARRPSSIAVAGLGAAACTAACVAPAPHTPVRPTTAAAAPVTNAASPAAPAPQPAATTAPTVTPLPSPGADLVELIALDPSLRLDVRYATANNFIGRAVYSEARAFLQRPAALALVRAHRALAARGLGLLIFDGYRPLAVTRLFWDLTPPEKRAFVANPAKGSVHNRGCAVDLTLFDRTTLRPVPMPSEYDDMSERAAPDYRGGTAEERAHRDLLRAALEREGFAVQPNEWWHFNFRACPTTQNLDLPFSAIPGARSPTP